MLEGIYKHLRELAPFKLEFIDEDDNYHKLDSYIKRIYGDYILISPPDKNGSGFNIPDTAEVNLLFPMEKGIFIAQCTVLGKELGTISGIKLSFPHDTQEVERREYIRVPVKIRIGVTCYQDQQYIKKQSFFAITKNLSATGVAFYHKESIDDYYNIGCKIYLNDENPKPVDTQNDLVYSKKVKIKDEELYLTAVTFTSISEADSARIVKECFKYQVRQKQMKKEV